MLFETWSRFPQVFQWSESWFLSGKNLVGAIGLEPLWQGIQIGQCRASIGSGPAGTDHRPRRVLCRDPVAGQPADRHLRRTPPRRRRAHGLTIGVCRMSSESETRGGPQRPKIISYLHVGHGPRDRSARERNSPPPGRGRHQSDPCRPARSRSRPAGGRCAWR